MSYLETNDDPATSEVDCDLLARSILDLLRSAVSAAGAQVDEIALRDTMARAVARHPGPWQQTWTQRIAEVAEVLEFQCFVSTKAVQDVIELPRPGSPVVLFAPSKRLPGGWLMLTDRSLRKVLVERHAGQGEWKSVRALLRQLGVATRETQVRFVALQVSAPCAPATTSHGEEENDGHRLPPLRRLVRLLSLDARDLGVVTIFAIGVGLLSMATPITVELLVNTIAFGNLMQPVVILSLLLFICLAFVVGMQLIQIYVVEIVQRRIFVRCLSDLAYRIPRVTQQAQDHRYLPELVNRFLEVALFQKALASLATDGLFIVLQATFGMIVLAFYHPYLLGYDVAIMVAIATIIFVLGRGGTATAIAESVAKYESVGWLEELARQPAAIKARGGPEMALSRADEFAKRYLAARSDHFRILMRQVVASLSLQVVSSTVLLGLGGWLVIRRELTLGQLVAAELIVSNIVRSFAKFGKHFESFYDMLASTDKLGHLFDLPLERHGGEPPRLVAGPASVQLSDVKVETIQDASLFDGLSLQVAAGERVAVVGPAGSGKSTLLQLIYGAKHPSSGVLFYDGIDLRQTDLPALRSQCALVDSLDVLRGSILANVRWGRTEVSLADVNEALAAVGLLETVLQLPAGLDTRLEPDGSPLSHSGARALTIARAMAGKPRLILLDAVLDDLSSPIAELATGSLFDTHAPWTLIVVTSRDEIHRRCNRTIELGIPRSHTVDSVR